MKQYDAFWRMNNCIERASDKRYVWDLTFVSSGLLLLDKLEDDWQMQIYEQVCKYTNLFLIFPDGINLPPLYSYLAFILIFKKYHNLPRIVF